MAQTFRPEFLRRTMYEVLNYGNSDELVALYNKDAYNDKNNLNTIIEECKKVFDPERTILPYLYLQAGSDQYPYEVVKVYRKSDGTPTMLVVREMEWKHGAYSEESEVIGSKLDGDVKVLKKNRKGSWCEVGDYYKSHYTLCPLPVSYYDPNF